MHEEQTENGEGAPVHISAASARRRGPFFTVKLSSCCEVDRWRDSEWADPRQLRQLKWRSARAGEGAPSYAKVTVVLRHILSVNSSLIFCKFDFEGDSFL